jgi:succinyl-diaminopimelate desuccinylase
MTRALGIDVGTSGARLIKHACPAVEVGLVGATTHRVDERVPVDDIAALSRAHERALELRFAGRRRG